MKYTGSCLCGAVQYQVTGCFENFFLCHCSRCQKDTGSAHAANLFSKKAQLDWLSGKSLATVYNTPNTRHVKSFCSICGAALPHKQNDDALLVVPAGSLDTHAPIPPSGHIFTDSKANWEEHIENLPSFRTLPS